MTTPARLEANRRNALKSTGPRSLHGKAMAGRTALRRGFRSRNFLLPGAYSVTAEAAGFKKFVAAGQITTTNQSSANEGSGPRTVRFGLRLDF
jgi:hypothetical protein